MFREILAEMQEDFNTENIAVQKDIEFETKMDKLVQDLYDAHKLLGNPQGVKASRHHELNDHMGKLSSLLKDRFGLPIRLVYSDELAYVLPLTGTNSSLMDVKREEIVDTIIELEKEFCVDGNCSEVDFNKDVNDIDLIYSNKIINKLSNDMKTMNKIFAKGKVTVDFNKAKVKGLIEYSDKLVTPIAINVGGLISLNASVREIGAIILHEVGHQFTFIGYADTLVKTAIGPIESIMDGKNTKTKKKIILKEFGHLIDDDETKLYKFPEELMKRLNPMSKDKTAFFNSEISADRFAARMGYGEEVVTALNNFHFSSEREDPTFSLFMAVALMAVMVFIVITVTWTPETILLVLNLFMVLFAQTAYYILTAVTTGRGTNTWDEHEQSFARTRRMRLELINHLRNNNVSRSQKDTIDSIIRLGAYLEKVGQSKTFPMVLFSWLTGAAKEIGTHERAQRVEQLMENELHFIRAKRRNL